MKISTTLNTNQIKIISILYYAKKISINLFMKIWSFNIWEIFEDTENGLSKMIQIIISAKNENSKAFSEGYEEAFKLAKFKAEKNLFTYKQTNDFDVSKYMNPILSNISKPNYKNPYSEKLTSKGVLSNIEKEILHLEFMGIVKFDNENNDNVEEIVLDEKFNDKVSLTKEGLSIAKKIIENRNIIFRSPPHLRKNIFIASAFGYSDLDLLYTKEFLPACKKFGFNPIRVDINEPKQTITEYIIDNITSAECVIADLSYARPSVYFEVGFALGLGIPLLLTCRKDHFKGKSDNLKVHFDLEQYKISYWEKTDKEMFIWSKGMDVHHRLENILGNRNNQ